MQWTDRIGRRVKLRDLHILLAVAQSGSMARAADRLAISHPVVSKTISALEHALGVRLLDRTAQGVEPTAYGRAILNCSTVVFDELRRGVQEIEFLSDPNVGEVRIAATGVLMDGFIPAVIDQFAERYPRTTAQAMEGHSTTLCSMLRERKIDLVVSRTWGSTYGEDFATEALFDEYMFVVAGLRSRWAGRRKIDISELIEEPWVMPETDNVMSKLMIEGFHSSGIAMPAVQIITNSMAVRTRLVETGRCLTMLPGSMLHFGASRLAVKILPVALPMKSQPVEIISLKGRTPTAVTELFIKELRTATKTLRSSGPHPTKRETGARN